MERVMLYRCISADPPWPEKGGGKSKRGADRHYPVMHPYAITTTMAHALFAKVNANAHLWLWVTDNYLEHGLTTMRSLGFRFIRMMVWNKPKFGLGQYLRGKHEVCLFGVMGKLPPLPTAKRQPSSFDAPLGKHSEKPARAYEIIEAVSPGPRLELFARAPREGWTVWGNEVTP